MGLELLAVNVGRNAARATWEQRGSHVGTTWEPYGNHLPLPATTGEVFIYIQVRSAGSNLLGESPSPCWESQVLTFAQDRS